MLKSWIVNASPTILLCKMGQVNLLYELAEDLIIPSGVAEEISRGRESDVARQWLEHEGSVWIRETGLSNPMAAVWGLGLGETQVLSYALTYRSYIAIVDDRAARNCAWSLQIPVRGTLGVLLLAKQVGKIEQVKPLVRQLQQAGLRLEMKLVAEVIRLVVSKIDRRFGNCRNMGLLNTFNRLLPQLLKILNSGQRVVEIR